MRNAGMAVLLMLLWMGANGGLSATAGETVALPGATTAPGQDPGQVKMLTVEAIYGSDDEKVDFSGEVPRGLRWLKDGAHYLESGEKGGLLQVDARSGESTTLLPIETLEKAFSALPGFDAESAPGFVKGCRQTLAPDEAGLLLRCANDLFYYDLTGGALRRLTSDSASEEFASLSPSGKLVAYVKDHDLQVTGVAGGAERRLTEDGTSDRPNGKLDWVYQEEIYGRGTFGAFWWSPDSQHLAFLQLDDTPVPTFEVVDHIPTQLELEVTHYPKSGDPNPTVRLGIVSVLDGSLRWVDLYRYQAGDFLIVHVSWSPDSQSLLFQVQDREQTWLDLDRVAVKSGKIERLLREESQAWVNRLDEPRWLEDGSFLWRSERTGFAHLYHYSADGALLGTLTQGDWEVRRVLVVDEKEGWVYFSGSRDSVVEAPVYRVSLQGGEVTRLTPQPGSHSANFNPQATLFIDSWSDALTPTQVVLCEAGGRQLRTITENPVPALSEYRLGSVEFLQVPTRDGFVMEAMMIKPPDFDPSRKYPVMSYTYSGPHAQSVSNRWGGTTYMWHQLLAQKGYIIWVCDNRTASGKGVASAWKGFHNLGEWELRDLEDGLGWLKQQTYVDGSRIGLWGWSYGGYMTSFALTHSESFKIGIAGAPVTDWSLYDSVYTERYMGMPQTNPEGYAKSSVVQAAANLHGRLLLIHGTIDDNVHIQNSMQFILELQKAGKDFRFMAYPKSRHGVRDPKQVLHLRRMMTDFILENL